ncbi:MAG: flagellar basal body-associated FliL family protein [Pseudomonadota bacterium]
MKAILFPMVMAASAAGGVFAADMLRGEPGGHAPAGYEAHGAEDGYEKEGHAKDDKAHGKSDGHAKSDKPAKSDKKGHGDKGASSGSTEYIKFKRQFVVPVLKNEAVDALILLNLGIEVSASRRDEMFRKEPRFRDAFIRELLQLSDRGYFDQELTSPDTYEVLRETLARAAKEISEDGVTDVLILDLSRQDR